ncbi:SMI1/KNR4 family protein [Chryseobacterium sp. LC2016-29]|uniref:SMI1/KNR4 family protein n=1 Tax=Chryseobacterium sp. LC2016-29 TaxID=2897331 RepID=UPI001E3B309E|nr:SMI1/KNR4 family protein [Chryseobacterium sp. LC2016-29]MCD0477019.1 SMI1/KNR4 family protein [Chryseobacterium sp. LC2016-29]
MRNNNFRFVNNPENQNEGLTNEEIDNLQEESNLRFPKAYISFLQKAGKKSNVFQVETNAKELRKIQDELRLELDKLNLLPNQNILCIKKHEAFEEYFNSNFETYYFFNLSENKWNPTLYIFEEVCINEGWNAFEKRITKVKGNNFIVFINEAADKKYGITIKQHFKNIPMYIISIPIFILLIILLGIEALKEKILNK